MSKSIYLGLLLLAFATFSCSTSENPAPQEPEQEQEEEIELATAGTASGADITENSILISATVSGESITDRGVVYGIDQNPTLSNNSVSSGSGAGSFSVTIENLQSETTYYARIYASNQAGTAYGPELEFQTLEEIPQLIFDGDVVLESQAEVDAFGANNYTDITGSLTIDAIEEITDLTPLSTLMTVGEIFEIRTAPDLLTLEGLHRLRTVGDRLRLFGLERLVNLNGLRGLQQVTNSLAIIEANTITDLTGLEQVSFVEAPTLAFFANDNLISMEGLNIPAVCDAVLFNDNPSLSDLSQLNTLTEIQTSLQILNNDALVSSSGFTNLTRADFFTISQNDNLVNLDGFDNLADARVIQILENNSLLSISGLNQLSSGIETVIIDSCPSLVSLNGLNSLQSIGRFGLSDCPLILNIDELAGLNNVSEDIRILNNQALEDFCGIRLLLQNGGLQGKLVIASNAYNPTEQDIIDGNCKL